MVDNTLTNGFASACGVMSNFRLTALRQRGERKGLFFISGPSREAGFEGLSITTTESNTFPLMVLKAYSVLFHLEPNPAAQPVNWYGYIHRCSPVGMCLKAVEEHSGSARIYEC
ncbi:hypothetical protein H109_00362 [Trichophyton interdigitale MR816]|uniref:Uncharacterized protein n=1 Tax=Trichophyton interdigitale (strain MR816) TaxID=1215338 RepID=A0A059JJ16_TRIIM|nr:hypothetical protein H109_00362 [Trichophyton interdigitale MR816]